MTTVSHHFLRRTARRKAVLLAAKDPKCHYRVVEAKRGPFGWRVVRISKD